VHISSRGKKSPCRQCAKTHAPLVDEYYFWLQDTSHFDISNAVQDAGIGTAATDLTSEWEDPSQLPKLLYWPPEPMVHLFWARIRCGILDPPRRSDKGVHSTGNVPDLEFVGRTSDSLVFTALQGSTTAGFRYDIVTDRAVTPQVIPDTFVITDTFPTPPPPLKNYALSYTSRQGPHYFKYGLLQPHLSLLEGCVPVVSSKQLSYDARPYMTRSSRPTHRLCALIRNSMPVSREAQSRRCNSLPLQSLCPSSPVKNGFGRGHAVTHQLDWGLAALAAMAI
jgi:hypothetical protein